MAINRTDTNRVNPITPSSKPKPKMEDDPKEPFSKVLESEVEESGLETEEDETKNEQDSEPASRPVPDEEILKKGIDDEVLRREAANRAYGKKT